MSAFVMHPFHINALVSWAANRQGHLVVSYYWGNRWHEIRNDEQRIASVLHAENVRSVNYRYNEKEAAEPFKYERTSNRLTLIDIIKACHGYAYQACETPDWEDTEAHAIIEAIEACAVRSLPGYDDSKAWSLTPERAAA